PASSNFAHPADAFSLELYISHRQHFVHEQDFWLQLRRHCEGQAHVHAAGILLHRRIEKLFHLGKANDLVELALNLSPPHADNRAVDIDVLTASQLRMKPGPDFEQRSNTTAEQR